MVPGGPTELGLLAIDKSRVHRERSFSLSAFASVTVYGCSDTLRLLLAIPWPGELRGHPLQLPGESQGRCGKEEHSRSWD